MAKMFKAIVSVLIVITAFLFAGCADGWHYENAPAKTTVKVWADPVDSTTINLVDSTGNILVTNYMGHGWAWVKTEPIKYADAKEAWAKAERLYKSFSKQVNTTDFRYNHGVNTIESGVKIIVTEDRIFDLEDKKVVLTKSQEIPLWKPERLNLKGDEPVSEETPGKQYYAETVVKYSLCCSEVVLAQGTQYFVAEEGYVPAFLRAQVIDRDKHNMGTVEAKLANGKINITCLDSLLYAELFDDNSLRNEGRLPFHSFNECSLSISGTEVNDTTAVVGKSWTGGAASLGGFELSTSWLSNKVSEKSLVATMSNGAKVDFIDSVHVCKWVPTGGKVLSTKKVRLDYAREGVPADKTSIEIDVNITQREKPVTLVGVDSTFVHNAFVSTATVSGNNIAVICNNTASFVKVWNNNTKDQKQDVKYTITNNFGCTMPAYISSDAKGKTYSFNGSTATVVGKNVIVSFTNRVIADIMFNNKNYKNDKAVPKCEVTVTTIKFGESTAVITFTHENEKVTAEVPVTYNGVSGYERVGDPIHDSWNATYGTSNGFGITCNNHVVVREVMYDETKGSSFDLPYKSTNVWTVSGKTSFQVENLSSILNVRYDIVNGSSATVDGNTINFAHSMSAENVSKGTFSYQPAACEAVARYITVISATQARVDIYHGNNKVGDYVIPVNITEKPKPADVDVEILRISITDAYQNQHAAQEGTYLHIFGKKDGNYVVLSQRVGGTAFQSTTLSDAEGSAVLASGRAIAYVFNGSNYQIGTVTSEDGKADKGYYLRYYVADGRLAYSLGSGTATEALKDGFRDAIRGTVSQANSDGSWSVTADGKTYTFVGL